MMKHFNVHTRLAARVVLATTVAAFMSPAAVAATPLNFSSYLAAVEAHSLELKAQNETVTSAKAGVGIAGIRPDPEFSIGASRETVKTGANRPVTWTPTVSMVIETGGKRDARLKAARSNVLLAEETVAGFKSELYATAAAAFTEACRTREVVARKEQTMTALSKVVDANGVRRKVGDVGGIELLQSRVERDQFQAELMQARSDADSAMLNLSSRGRAFLIIVGALAVDERGEETLVGLTVLESDYFLKHQEFTDQRLIHQGASRFLVLMERHLIARRQALPLNPA